MKDIKKIQEFFSKPLNEGKQLDITDFQKVVQAVKSTGHPATVMLVPKWNEIEIITGMNAPDDMIYDISKATSPLGYNHKELSMSGDSSSLGRGEYSEIEKVNGGHMDYRRFEESVKEMEYGDPVDAVFRKYAGKTIEMDFEDMESDWANLLNDLEDYFPGDKLSDFMDSGEADLYLDDYNITLMEPIMDKDVDLDVLKRAKAKMDIDKMRYDAGMPPMDSIASLNEDEDIDFEYRAVLDKFKDIMKGLDVKEADALQQKLKAYFAGLDENMKKSFTDYTNQELAAYVKNTKDKKAAKELHKRSQKLKNLSRTDVNERADHVNPMVAKAYKDYIKAKKDSAADIDFAEDPEKAYRYYSKKLNNTYSTKADRDAIEAILKKKYGSALEESLKEMDINDPVAMKFRAAQDKLAKMRAANAGDDGNDKFFRKSTANAKKLAALKKYREQLMRDMEQEAEPEGGPIADKYGAELNKIDKAIAMLQGSKKGGMVDPYADHISMQNAMMGLEENKIIANRILKKYGIKPLKTVATAVRGFRQNVGSSQGYAYNRTYPGYAWLSLHGIDSKIIDQIEQEFKEAGLEKLYRSGGSSFTFLNNRDVNEGGVAGWKKASMSMIKHVQKQLDDMGVKYEMGDTPYAPFKTIYKPINKSDDWYDKFDDLIWRANLRGVVKTAMNEAEEEDATDIVAMDVPLFIRVLEYAREDAQADMDLHDLAEKAIAGTKEAGVLTMDNYDMLVGEKESVDEAELTEAYVPSNIKEFAKRRGISSLVNKVAGWAEKVGARITGGTAIGKNYNTLILDLGYQTADIRIDVEDETIELYDEPIYSFADFKNVFMEEVTRQQAEHDEEQLRREQGLEEKAKEIAETIKLGLMLNEELCPKGKAYIKRRLAAGEKSSAYLSGRAVKVCKGQMSGRSKKK